jgi:hypothetical protein
MLSLSGGKLHIYISWAMNELEHHFMVYNHFLLSYSMSPSKSTVKETMTNINIKKGTLILLLASSINE